MKAVNFFAKVWLTGNYFTVHIIGMQVDGVSPKQFLDTDGCLWFSNELTNIEHP